MNIFYHGMIAAFLLTVRASVLPAFVSERHAYDLLVPLVVYVGLCRPVVEGVVLAVFIGVLMDSLSAGPAGFYSSNYVWLYIIAHSCSRFFRAGNLLIVGALILCGVLLQNLSGLIVVWSRAFDSGFAGSIGAIGGQTGGAIVTGPLIYLGVSSMHGKWVEFWRQHFRNPDLT